jgi:hypothetical protein
MIRWVRWNRVAKQTAYKKRRNASDRRQYRQQRRRQQVVEPARSTTMFGRDDMFIAFGLVAVTLAVYAQVMSHQFIILDDNRYIRENAIRKAGTDADWNRVGIHHFLRRHLA